MIDRKPFSKRAYLKASKLEKDLVRFLRENNIYAVKNLNPFGIDLILGKKKKIHLEVEGARKGRRIEEWEYFDIPYRKKKYFQIHPSSYYLRTNSDFSQMILVSGQTILTSEVVIKTTVGPIKEKFFRVLRENCIIGTENCLKELRRLLDEKKEHLTLKQFTLTNKGTEAKNRDWIFPSPIKAGIAISAVIMLYGIVTHALMWAFSGAGLLATAITALWEINAK